MLMGQVKDGENSKYGLFMQKLSIKSGLDFIFFHRINITLMVALFFYHLNYTLENNIVQLWRLINK